MHRVVPQESGGRLSRSQLYCMFSVSGDVVWIQDDASEPDLAKL